jgi:acyl dehydratase
MTSPAFDNKILERDQLLFGSWRSPRQMLHAQVFDSHASIHDDATAQKLGFQGGTIEGPTHFSQFAPLCEEIWGKIWFETGCLSAHYRNPVFEGEEVQANISKLKIGQNACTIGMAKRDGIEVLRGTASVGGDGTETALHQRLSELKPLSDPVILRDVRVGMKTERLIAKMDFDDHMGDLYPFSLRDKLKVITEPSRYYSQDDNPWGRPIIPFEMLSVLFQYRAREDGFPVRGPAVGLFADQEIRLLRGPLFVGESYFTEREIVALSGSRRTESMWVRTTVFATDDRPVATMLLNLASIKDSYANFEPEYSALYPQNNSGN